MNNPTDPAIRPGPKPGDFPLGSLESRAAARVVLQGRCKPEMVIRVVYIKPDGLEVGHDLITSPEA